MLERITEKVGPFPVWAYGVIIGGAAGLYFFYFKRKPTAAGEAGDGADSTPPLDPNAQFDPNTGLMTDYGGSSPYTSGSLGSAIGTDPTDTNELYAINPATGRPYIVDINSPINPVTGNPYNQDYVEAITREDLLKQIRDDNAAELERLRAIQNQPPAAAAPVAMVEPAPPAPAPAPAPPPPPPGPAPATKRTVGPWSTKAARDSQVAGLIARGVPVRVWSDSRGYFADIWD